MDPGPNALRPGVDLVTFRASEGTERAEGDAFWTCPFPRHRCTHLVSCVRVLLLPFVRELAAISVRTTKVPCKLPLISICSSKYNKRLRHPQGITVGARLVKEQDIYIYIQNGCANFILQPQRELSNQSPKQFLSLLILRNLDQCRTNTTQY